MRCIEPFCPGDVGRRNYSSAFNCFARIAREEGYRAFYKVPFSVPCICILRFNLESGNGSQLSRSC